MNDEKIDLKKQFQVVIFENSNYKQSVRVFNIEIFRRIKNFSLIECELLNDQIYYRNERRLIFNDDVFEFRLMKLIYDIFLIDHSNAYCCYQMLSRNYWWNDMIQNIRKFIKNCLICVRIKYFRHKFNDVFKSFSIFERRWHDISINFVIKLFFNKNDWNVEYKHIIIVINRLFKNFVYETINNLTFENVIKTFLRIVLFHWSLFFNTISNREIQFVKTFWKYLCKCLNIDVKFFIVYHF